VERLAINKPDFLTVPVLVVIGLSFVLATMTLVAMSFALAFGFQREKKPVPYGRGIAGHGKISRSF